MDDQQRRDDGMNQRRKVLGDAWVDKSIANKNSFNADFIDLITRHAWGEIWTRPHLDQRTRRVAVGSVRVAPGRGTAIIRSAKIFCTRGQVQIVVSLERPTEYIDDWMSCSP